MPHLRRFRFVDLLEQEALSTAPPSVLRQTIAPEHQGPGDVEGETDRRQALPPEPCQLFSTIAGFDPARVAVDGGAAARQIIGMARLRAAADERKATEGQLDALRARIAEQLRSTGANVKEALAKLLSDQSQLAPQVHFRKVENLSDEDAINMLTEAELLKLWEELEDDDGASGHGG